MELARAIAATGQTCAWDNGIAISWIRGLARGVWFSSPTGLAVTPQTYLTLGKTGALVQTRATLGLAMIKSCKRCVYICHNPDMRQAIARGDTDAIVARLDRPACLGLVSLDLANGDGSGNGGPLHLAAEGDAEELVAALLDRGALVNATDAAGETALHLAARRGSVAVLNVLLSDPAVQPDLPNARLQIPIEVAVEHAMWACARLLLRSNSAVPAGPEAGGGQGEGQGGGAAAAKAAAALRGVTNTLDACAALWPPPTVRSLHSPHVLHLLHPLLSPGYAYCGRA